jgi:hypothetical protein
MPCFLAARLCDPPGGGSRAYDRGRAVHVRGLLFLSAGGCSACRARNPTRRAGTVLSCRLLGQARLEGPFSSPAATERQQRYAEFLKFASVYTPQLVVDGKWQAVGSDRVEVERALARAKHGQIEVPLALTTDHGLAQIKLGSVGVPVAGAVLLIGFDRRHVTAVARGENSGRILAHANVVRGVEEVGQFSGGASAIEAPIRWQCDRVAAIVQAPSGEILGVAIGDVQPR